MTEKKIASPEIARATWEEMDDPSVRRVEAKLKSAGYVTPSYRTINKWQKEAEQAGSPWATVKGKRGGPADRMKAARQNLDDAAAVLTGDPRSNADDAARKALPPPEQPKAEQARSEDPKHDNSDDAARERLKAVRDAIAGEVTDESLLTMAARQTLKTAIIIEALLGEMAPALLAVAPEAVGKLQLAVAESLAAAGEPYDRVGRARELAMKTIGPRGMNGHGMNGHAMNGEIIMPGQDDPLADVLAAL